VYRVIFFTSIKGDCPIKKFLIGIDKKPRAKILKFIGHLEKNGPNLPRPYADILRDKIRELRVPYGNLHWAVPEDHIQRSVRSMKDWLSRGGH